MIVKDELLRKIVSGEIPEDALAKALSIIDGQEMVEESDGMMDIGDAMKFLKISRCYLYLLRKRGSLRSCQLGKRVLFHREDLLRLVKGNRSRRIGNAK